MEIRDLYDINKKLTGKTIKAGEKIPKGNYILVVLVMIKNSNGEYLIQKRAEGKKSLYGATGGHCKSGETGLMGAITETKEELGIKLNPEELTLLYGGRQDDTQVFYEVFYTQKDIDINNLKIQKDEVDSVEWMNVSKIKALVGKSQFLEYHVDEIFKAIELLDVLTNKSQKRLYSGEER
jgi:8-oxo-dGTP pyrophosphatase MutT (NUDIX family)